MAKKRHHFRPVHHLKHFAGPDGLIWTLDKSGSAAPFAQKPENIGYEKGLYAIQSEGEVPTDAFEDWLAEAIDRPAAGPLAKAAKGESLTVAERSRLATYIAVQDLRTPRTRGIALEKFATDRLALWVQLKADPDGLIEDLARETGARFTVEEIRQHLNKYDAMSENDFWLGLIRSFAEKAAKLVFGLNWNHGIAPIDTPFVTTDIGIAKCVGDATNLVPWAPGFEGGRNRWIVPLTPACALILEPEGIGMSGLLQGSWVAAVNARLMMDAVRWVYSRERPKIV